LFAHTDNAKTAKFLSAYSCPGTHGVDSFNYDWGNLGVCWAFPPVRLILRTLQYAYVCKATVLFLVPQWRGSNFYPILCTGKRSNWIRKSVVYDGASVLRAGSDEKNFFGPYFKGNVEVHYVKFDI
jgi:hypothetical protein